MLDDLSVGYLLFVIIPVLVISTGALAGYAVEKKENRWFLFIIFNLALVIPTVSLFNIGFIPTFLILRWRHTKNAPPPSIVKLNI